MTTLQKRCTKCSEVKSIDDFHLRTKSKDGHRPHCKVCAGKYDKAYAGKNKEKLSSYRKHWRDSRGKESAAAYQRDYRAKNKEEVEAREAAYRASHKKERAALRKSYKQNNRRKVNDSKQRSRKRHVDRDPSFRLRVRLATRLYIALKGKAKASTTMALVGCTRAELMLYLEVRFKPGMTWDNYGPVWHIDHIKPCSRFRLENAEDQHKCFHYSNLQPLFGPENVEKSDKYEEAA